MIVHVLRLEFYFIDDVETFITYQPPVATEHSL